MKMFKLKKTEIEFNNLTVIYSSENVGYFKGLNIGIKYLRANYSNIDWMVIGNNDVLFPELFYMSILDKKLLLKKYPVISPNIITADGFHQNPHVIKKTSKFFK